VWVLGRPEARVPLAATSLPVYQAHCWQFIFITKTWWYRRRPGQPTRSEAPFTFTINSTRPSKNRPQ
jgi:hypothetical protein